MNRFVLVEGGCRDRDSESAFVDFNPIRTTTGLSDVEYVDVIYRYVASCLDESPDKPFPVPSEGIAVALRDWINDAEPGDVLQLRADRAVLCVSGCGYLREYGFEVTKKIGYDVTDHLSVESSEASFAEIEATKPKRASRRQPAKLKPRGAAHG